MKHLKKPKLENSKSISNNKSSMSQKRKIKSEQDVISIKSEDDETSSSSDSSDSSLDVKIESKQPSHVSKHASPNWTCDCSLDLLRYKPFSSHSYEEQVEIIKKGRPTPELTFTKERKGRGVCKFQNLWYRKNPWLCGCLKTQKMYCWPCVLFGTNKNSSWGGLEHGISDLPNFSLLRQRHTMLKEHISSLVQLERFGKQPITLHMSNADKIDAEAFNNTVQSNRYVLTRLIDMFCFLRTQHEGDDGSVSSAKYSELLRSMSQVDPVLSHHLNHATLSLDNPTTTDDMVLAIAQVINESIKTEISQCNFVSWIVMSEPAEDVTRTNVFSSVRYLCNHEVRERFIKFEEVSADRTIAAYLSYMTKTLKEFDCRTKLVCHTYDGATVKCGSSGALQRYVRTKYPAALFLPSHTHHLCWVLQQSIRAAMKECDTFLQTCSQVAAFFRHHSHAPIFINILGWDASSVSSWKFIILIKNTYETLQTLLCDMATGDRWEATTRAQAAEIVFSLKHNRFQFLLTLFSQLFPKAERYFDAWQDHMNDPAVCEKLTNEFIIEVSDLRQSVADDWEEDTGFDEHGVPCKTPRFDLKTNALSARVKTPQALAGDIIVHVKAVVRERHGSLADWEFLAVLNTHRFSEMMAVFPAKAFQSLENAYENHFDFNTLKMELQVLYADASCYSKPLQVLFDYMKTSRLSEALPQVYRLMELFLCLPVTSCDSALNQLSLGRNRLSPTQLALLSIDKKSLKELSRSSMFYDQVIEKFRTSRDCGLELRYKILEANPIPSRIIQ